MARNGGVNSSELYWDSSCLGTVLPPGMSFCGVTVCGSQYSMGIGGLQERVTQLWSAEGDVGDGDDEDDEGDEDNGKGKGKGTKRDIVVHVRDEKVDVWVGIAAGIGSGEGAVEGVETGAGKVEIGNPERTFRYPPPHSGSPILD